MPHAGTAAYLRVTAAESQECTNTSRPDAFAGRYLVTSKANFALLLPISCLIVLEHA